MAMQYVNGELVDDENQGDNPLAGMNVASSPNRTNQNYQYTSTPLDDNDLQGFRDYVGKYTAPQGRNWFSHEMGNIATSYANSKGMGNDSNYIGSLAGKAYPGQTFQQAPADLFPEGQGGGGDFDFGSMLLPLLVAGIATGGFGLFGAGAGAGAGAAGFAIPNAAAVEAGILGGLEASGIGAGLGGAAGAGSLAGIGDISLGLEGLGGSVEAGLGALPELSAGVGSFSTDAISTLSDLYGYDAGGASTFMGEQGGISNLEQALQTPQISSTPSMPDIPTVEDISMGYNPETATSIDQVAQAGLDKQAPIVDKSVSAGMGDTTRLAAKAGRQMMDSPWFQIAKTGLNLYGQNQKANQLKDIFNQFRQQSDVGGPFRDLLMRSMTDPNFFKSMPEFQAGMGAFDKQYRANAGKNGTRSQLGGAAHNIAVNQEAAKLADIYRSRLSGPASAQPNMSGAAAIAPAMVNAGGNQYASLMDPALWRAIGGLF